MTNFRFLSRDIKYPYAVISDCHLHNWSAFSYPTDKKVNNRLQIILDCILSVATELLKQGGNDLVITGDLFHQRGNIKPSVYVPSFDLFMQLSDMGIRVHFIPGNHDLEGNTSDRLGNAVQGLSAIPNFFVYNEPTIVDEAFMFVPWMETSTEVLEWTTKGSNLFSNLTLFCHIGMSGVLPTGKIGNVVNPDDFAAKDLKYVFSGHFHNHVCFYSRIFSVGALTHQTWNDVDSLAGWLLVHPEGVIHYETSAPRFVDHRNDITFGEISGNFIRIKGELDERDAIENITMYKLNGALAVQDLSSRPSILKHSATTEIKVSEGIDQAIASFCKARFGAIADEVIREAQKVRNV